jgi:hypothetical protein
MSADEDQQYKKIDGLHSEEKIREIYQLYDGLGEILEVAVYNQRTVIHAVEVMRDEIKKLEGMRVELKNAIKQDCTESIKTVSEQTILEQKRIFATINQSVKQVLRNYKTKSIVFWLSMFLGSAFVLFLYVHSVRLTTPGLKDIISAQHELNSIKAEIEKKKKELREINLEISENKIEFASCDGRLCVQVIPEHKPNSRTTTYGKNGDFSILYGH